jgi:hypothetical protein
VSTNDDNVPAAANDGDDQDTGVPAAANDEDDKDNDVPAAADPAARLAALVLEADAPPSAAAAAKRSPWTIAALRERKNHALTPEARTRLRKRKMERARAAMDSGAADEDTGYTTGGYATDDMTVLDDVKPSSTFFQNAIEMVIVVFDGKLVDIKATANGKLHLTGCLCIEHAEDAIKRFVAAVVAASARCASGPVYTLVQLRQNRCERPAASTRRRRTAAVPVAAAAPVAAPADPVPAVTGQDPAPVQPTQPTVVFQCVMANKDISLGFSLLRENLDRVINTRTAFRSFIDVNGKYVGVIIKIPTSEPHDHHYIALSYTGPTAAADLAAADPTADAWQRRVVNRSEYLLLLSDEDRKRYLAKTHNHTFLVFASGSVIMSSPYLSLMEPCYRTFMDIIRNNRADIEVCLPRGPLSPDSW